MTESQPSFAEQQEKARLEADKEQMDLDARIMAARKNLPDSTPNTVQHMAEAQRKSETEEAQRARFSKVKP